MPFEISSVPFIAGLALVGCAGSVALLMPGHRSEHALRWYTAGMVTLGVVLLGYSTLAPPRPLAAQVACDWAIILNLACVLAGALRFSERHHCPWRAVAIITGTAGVALTIAATAAPQQLYRFWVFAGFQVITSILIVRVFIGGDWQRDGLELWGGPRWVMAILFACHAVFHVWHGLALGAPSPEVAGLGAKAETIHRTAVIEFVTLASVFAWGVAAMVGQKASATLSSLARRDALTALPNRRAFMAVFEGHCRPKDSQAGCVLAAIDIDDFKAINDAYGHDTGDRVLTSLGQQLQDRMREQDVIARTGGDEFLCLFTSTDEVGATTRLQQLIHGVAPVQLANGETLRPSLSVGIARAPDDGMDFDTLYRIADRRLYQAKTSGKGCVAGAANAPSTSYRPNQSASAWT